MALAKEFQAILDEEENSLYMCLKSEILTRTSIKEENVKTLKELNKIMEEEINSLEVLKKGITSDNSIKELIKNAEKYKTVSKYLLSSLYLTYLVFFRSTCHGLIRVSLFFAIFFQSAADFPNFF